MAASGRLAGFVDLRRFFPLVNTSAKGFGLVSDGKLNMILLLGPSATSPALRVC